MRVNIQVKTLRAKSEIGTKGNGRRVYNLPFKKFKRISYPNLESNERSRDTWRNLRVEPFSQNDPRI